MAERSRRRGIAWPMVLLLVVAGGVIVLAQLTAARTDQQNANIISLIAAAVALFVPWLRFVFARRFAAWIRLSCVAVMLLAAICFALVFRVDHVGGTLVPAFRFRWSARPDELLDLPGRETAQDETQPEVDLTVTSEFDFPRFLGPAGNGTIAGPDLARCWKTTAPEARWNRPIGAGWSAFAAVNGFAVTMEQRGEHELVTCYDVRGGELKWWHTISARHSSTLGGVGPRSTPTIDAGRVYALGATGVLRCLDGATGKEVWPSKDVPQLVGVLPADDETSVPWGRAASPLIVGDLVVVPAGGPPDGPFVSLLAFQKETGQLVWRGGQRQISYSSPTPATIDGVEQIIIVCEDWACGHDAETGRVLWEYPWPGCTHADASTSQPLVLPDDHVLLSKGYGGGALLLHLSRNAGGNWQAEPVWRDRTLLKTKFSNVAPYGEHVYALSDGILECIEWRTGSRMWKRGRYRHGQLLRVGSLLLVLGERGDVFLVEASPNGHHELGKFPALTGKTWNTFCLYGADLLVRNAEEAACYQLPLE